MYKLLPILLFAYSLAITTADIYDNSYALIIGIDKYENVRSLDYAVKDAEDIQSMLVDKFHFQQDNIVLLKNEKATKTSIFQEFSNITKKAESNDRVLIFFAGHGMTDDLPDGGEMGYLLPIKAKRDELFTTSIPMDDLKRISSMSKSKHMLFLIDACYGGLAATGARGLSSTTPNYIDKITKDKSRQIITAGGRGEQVIEKSEWGHSAFTLNLIRALEDGKADLNDDGYITAEELGLFLKEKVSIDSGNQQTPQSRRYTSQEGEFVFVYAENTIINQQVDGSTDDEFKALVLDKLENLEKQTGKSKPDLKVNPDLQQSDYPLIYSWIWSPDNGYLWGTIMKQLDERSVAGLALGHIRYADDWRGEFVDATEFAITPYVGYYLTPRKTNIFNPLIRLSLSLNLEKRTCETLQLKDFGEELNIKLALINKVPLNKDFGFSFGLEVQRHGIQHFNDDGGLYVERYEFMYYPTFSMDQILLKKYYGALSSLDRISLRERKIHDLISFSIWYVMPNLTHLWYGDGRIYPLLLIPAIGPFLLFKDDYIAFGHENIAWMAGVNQIYFLFDYIRTSKKLKGLNNNISYQINLNPIAPLVKFTYDFD